MLTTHSFPTRRSSYIVRRFRKDHACGVGADVAGDAGQHVDPRVGMEAQVELARPQRDAGIGGQREGRAAEFRRVDAEQQMVHDRIADRSEEKTSELQSLMRITYAVFCLTKKKN